MGIESLHSGMHTSQASVYLGLCCMKRLGVFQSPLERCQSIAVFVGTQSPGGEKSALPKNTEPGLEPGPLDPGKRALTTGHCASNLNEE